MVIVTLEICCNDFLKNIRLVLNQMDSNKPRKEGETIVEIGSSESEYEEERRNEFITANKRARTVIKSVGRICNFEGSEDGEGSSNSYITSVKSSDEDYEDIESLMNKEQTPLLGKPQLKEKRKISNSKKAPKPPRPRKGPSLDIADMQLVKEIAEQTMKRRARAERMKSLKKRRAAKSSTPPATSNISIFAMAITVLFFIVIVFHGFGSSQSSNLSFVDSPKSSEAPVSGLISIQLGNDVLESNGAQQIAEPPKKLPQRKIFQMPSSFTEQKSVSDSRTSVE